MLDRPLQLFNSLGRELQEFNPVVPGRVGLYTCGLTVYNYAHIGNLRAYLFTDTLRRVLQWKGYDVNHVMNITDVGHLTSDADEGDDKMELAAERRGKTVWELAEFYTGAFEKDLVALNILAPSVWCKATDHIQEMIAFARRIEDNGFGYQLEDGLYLDTSRVSDYGALAQLDLEGQQEGARVETKEGKRQASDFVVWRRSPEDSKRLMEWHSPWGVGAPGWHLECSVMSIKYLGHHFDIHTGGIDHRQVHHCNEIAQNEAFLGRGCSAVNYWMHNEFLTFGEEAEKMSKSTGRFLRLATLVDWGIHPLAYRHFVLMATYRRPLEFSFEALVAAKNGLARTLRRVAAIREEAGEVAGLELAAEVRFTQGGPLSYLLEQWIEPLSEAARGYVERLDESVSRDLNTPQALAHLGELLADDALEPADVLRLVAIYEQVLGLGLLTTAAADLNLRPAAASLASSEVDALLVERQEARASRDFARADEVRDQLQAEGVLIHDSRDGTTWEWSPRSD
ncbi:MAG: cysteine--tRNA ligase [Acidobacteriota bacterium]